MMHSETMISQRQGLGRSQPKLDKGIESMRKLVYAFYNEGFSFSQFLKKYPEQTDQHNHAVNGQCFQGRR